MSTAKPQSTVDKLKDLASIILALGVLATFGLAFPKAVKAEAGTAVAPVQKELDDHKADEARVHAELRSSMIEVQKDVRALYDVVLSRQRSARLEGPPTLTEDGGR